jgi:hypothetical protein
MISILESNLWMIGVEAMRDAIIQFEIPVSFLGVWCDTVFGGEHDAMRCYVFMRAK